MSSSVSYKFSQYLYKLLSKKDQEVILAYIERNVQYGTPPVNTHFPIRASNGLEAFNRIDVYVSQSGMIFVSNIDNKKTLF